MMGDGLCHFTLPAGKTSSPVAHRHVEEIWYILEKKDEVWRKNSGDEEVVRVGAGTGLTIPPYTAFQFRNTGVGPLRILFLTMPSWPGSQEAEKLVGRWPHTFTPGADQADEGEGRGEP